MKNLKIFILLSVITLSNVLYSQLTFKSLIELNEYAFQNTDLNELTNGYFLDNINNFEPSKKDSVFQSFKDESEVTTHKLFSFLNLLEVTDVSQSFISDSLVFPTFDDLIANDGQRQINIPLLIVDVDVNYLSESAYNQFQNWDSESPYPTLTPNQLESERLTIAGLLIDTLVNSNIHIYWDEETYITNTSRDIAAVIMFIGDEVIELQKSQKVDLSRFYNLTQAIGNIAFQVVFSDSSTAFNNSTCFLSKPSNIPTKLNIDSQAKFNFWDLMGGFNTVTYFGEDPELQFSVLWGCGNENKLKKPFIHVTGFGPYTDRNWLNNIQGWPSTIEQAYWEINQEGFIDELSGAGYDIIIVKFYPPNASVVKNAQVLVKLIELINEEKFNNLSYEENIITGYSAGAMAVRLALQEMEKKHIETNSPHHHSKLFISYDGEHGGANIPLGVQHSVKHLKQFQHGVLNGNLSIENNNIIHALYYILNSKLSRELLYYFYTKTGDPVNPGQAPSQDRIDYLQKHDDFNHSKNNYNPGYPVFTRNISISNGISQSRINNGNSDHYPYPEAEGHTFFEHERSQRRWKANFVGPGWQNASVFRYDEKSWWQWEIVDEARVNNPLILDNSPGGTSSISEPHDDNDANTMYQVINMLETTTTAVFGTADYTDYKALYSFTPTVLTHDIRNFDPFANNGQGRMHYDMKAEGLMYQSLSSFNTQIPQNASSFYGYPHFKDQVTLNHYTTYTPFDAVFSWDRDNNVHLSNHEVIFDEDRNNPWWGSAKGGWVVNENDNSLRVQVRDFLVGESDYFNAYIQNRRYGWNANPNTLYKATILARNEIFAGRNVTERTNFRNAEIWENADITFEACNTISLKPGFHAKSGASFHSKISTENCDCGGYKINNNSEKSNSTFKENVSSLYSINQIEEKSLPSKEGFSIFPNPGSEKVTLILENELPYGFTYKVFDLTGKEITQNKIDGNQTILFLEKGVYFVTINHENRWHTKKLIMY